MKYTHSTTNSYKTNLCVRIFFCFYLLCLFSQFAVFAQNDSSEILGFQFLSDISGHWVGTNSTLFGEYDWFSFDFRPISPSHVHSIYEGASNENIINSFFVANYQGKLQIMARNGGWLYDQYRATYFVLDRAETRGNERSYRLVDASGGVQRAYMEFRFQNDRMEFSAYTDESGELDDPIQHMGFEGQNYNPNYARNAARYFDFPQATAEINFGQNFENLIDPDSALYLFQDYDPFPKSAHGYVSDLRILIDKSAQVEDEELLLFISKNPLVNARGRVNFQNVDRSVLRTIDIFPDEDEYMSTYVHPDSYYITVFYDADLNLYPSAGDISSQSVWVNVAPESTAEASVSFGVVIR